MKHKSTWIVAAGCAAALGLALTGVAQEPRVSQGTSGSLMEGIAIEKVQSPAAEPAPAGGLSGQVSALEKKVEASSSLIAQLEAKRDKGAENPDRLMDLEADLAAAEVEKQKLARELESLKRKVAEMDAKAAQAPQPGVAAGSDLFNALERENAQLKQKMTELESARSKSEQKLAQAGQTEAELAALKDEEQRQRDAVGKLVANMPDMERELTELRGAVKEKDVALRERERALQAMAVELERREHRLAKTERMTEMLDQARADLRQVSDQEKRDMHFNMAAVYTRDGKFHEAEAEYLRALRLDPSDADAHFNLAILYDDHIDQKRRAAMHYKRYLKLRPDATDGDTVRAWLLDIEMEAGN